MASRIYTTTNSAELLDLSEELTRLSAVARKAAEELGEGLHGTDGWCNSLDGLDSLAKMLGGIVGQYRSPPPQLATVRTKIDDWRLARRASQAVASDLAGPKVRATGTAQKAPLAPVAKTPAKQPRAKGRAPKA